MNKRVIVTGSNGFTGRYVVKVLKEKGYRVVGLAYKNPGDNEIACDLTDKDAIREVIGHYRPDGIIHLAALSFVAHADQMAFYNVNLFGTLNLLDALEAEGGHLKKVVIASSANIYGNPSVDEITEETPPAPVNHYATSKLAMEHMVRSRFSRLPIIITRPFNYTGPGQSRNFLVPKIVSHYRDKKEVIELGNLDVARDFSDVRDIAHSYLMLYESDAHSEVFNLTSGRVYELKEIIELMNQVAGYKIKVSIRPDFVRPNEIKLLHGSNEKLKSLTGFNFDIPFIETLKDMYRS